MGPQKQDIKLQMKNGTKKGQTKMTLTELWSVPLREVVLWLELSFVQIQSNQ